MKPWVQPHLQLGSPHHTRQVQELQNPWADLNCISSPYSQRSAGDGSSHSTEIEAETGDSRTLTTTNSGPRPQMPKLQMGGGREEGAGPSAGEGSPVSWGRQGGQYERWAALEPEMPSKPRTSPIWHLGTGATEAGPSGGSRSETLTQQSLGSAPSGERGRPGPQWMRWWPCSAFQAQTSSRSCAQDSYGPCAKMFQKVLTHSGLRSGLPNASQGTHGCYHPWFIDEKLTQSS